MERNLPPPKKKKKKIKKNTNKINNIINKGKEKPKSYFEK
jgi:hypothetical protein